jgi:hypothetical protein
VCGFLSEGEGKGANLQFFDEFKSGMTAVEVRGGFVVWVDLKRRFLS